MSTEVSEVIEPIEARERHDYGIRQIPLSAPMEWLRGGIQDFRSAPEASLVYGLLFTAACIATLTLASGSPGFTLLFLTALLLMGPYLATGLYVAGRQLQAGEPVGVGEGLRTIARRKTGLALYALFLALVMAAWVRFASLVFAIKFDLASPSVEGYLGLSTGSADPAVIGYFLLVGLLLAAVVFVTSAVSIPMIVDRDVNPFTAIHTSARVVKRNWRPMLAWGGIVLGLTLVGALTYFVAMAVIFPVLGYATWRSYRAAVE
jgi:uncharacterized membrane protein